MTPSLQSAIRHRIGPPLVMGLTDVDPEAAGEAAWVARLNEWADYLAEWAADEAGRWFAADGGYSWVLEKLDTLEAENAELRARLAEQPEQTL